jgi:hypothetical protein
MEKLIYTIESSTMNSGNNQDVIMPNALISDVLYKTNNANDFVDSVDPVQQTKKIKIIEEEFYINELTEKISHMTKSSNKNDFIKKYNESHNQIKKVDEILYKPTTLDSNTDIKVLFEMLKEYEILMEGGDFTVQEYKNMRDLVELIEQKMKSLSMDVKEIQ